MRPRRPRWWPTLVACFCVAAIPIVGVARAQEDTGDRPDPQHTPQVIRHRSSSGTGNEGMTTPAAEPNCLDFASQSEAQAFYESNGGPGQDPHELDSDDDGLACEGMGPLIVVAQAGESITLAQATTSPSPTATATATVSPTPTPATTTSPTPTPLLSPTPSAGNLPNTGAPVRAYAVTGFVLTLAGLGLLVFNRTRRPAESWDEYSLLGW